MSEQQTQIPNQFDFIQAGVDAAKASAAPTTPPPAASSAEATPPPATPPAAAQGTTPPPAAAEPTATDYSKFAGGRFKTEEEATTFLSEAEQWKNTNQELQNKLAGYDGYIKPASEFVAKLNEITAAKGNVDLFLQLHPLKTDTMSAVDAVKFELMYKDGLTSEEADREVKFQFKLNKSKAYFEKAIADETAKGDEADEKIIQRLKEEQDEWDYAQQKLGIQGRKAKEFIEGMKVKAAEVPDVKKTYESTLSTWTPERDKLVPKSQSYEFTIGENGNTQKLKLDFPLDEEATKDVQAFVEAMAINFAMNNKKFEDISQEALQASIGDRIWAKNGARIAQMMVKTAVENNNKEWTKKVSNPESLREVVNPPSGEKPQAQKIVEDIHAHINS